MMTIIKPYELFADSLPHLLSYVIGKAATGDESAKKAIAEWEQHCPPEQMEINIVLPANKEA